ncbi:MAG: dienelactone hydrolase family protein [Alphaproteobacteria bacterium]|nr:dienelactone hydrolase family protein [Alphaproteobacteria bacterium]
MGEMITFSCPDGSTAEGYLAAAPNARSGIVVLQEWWGLNVQIKGVADRFAEAGFTALAPDLYHGRVTQVPDEANHMMEGLDWVGATEVEVRGACQKLKESVDKVGVVGYCMGGALTIIACVKLPEVSAGVSYYGIPPKEQADPAAIAVPFQGHFANTDWWCTPELVNDLEKVLGGSSNPVELHRYDAEHAFANEQDDAHHPESAAASWDRTVAFLKEHL